MIRVTIVPRVQDRLVDGVSRYLLGIISHADPPSLGIDLRVLRRGREMPAREWLREVVESDSPARSDWQSNLASRWVCKLDDAVLRPFALRRSRAAAIHYPLGWLPQGWAGGPAPRIVTLHGAAQLTGSWHPAQSSTYGEWLKQQIQLWLPKLARVITVSQWSKGEVVAAYDLPPELVAVIPNGVDLTRFRPLPRDDEDYQAWLQETLSIEFPYLLYVGPCSPRKNTLGLVQAFGRLKQRRHIPHRLVLAGASGQYLPTIKAEVTRLGLADHVIFAGPVDDETLVKLYNGASAFVFPSLYEGFGLPVLEAMACGTPVVTSNCTALPETAGEAAVLVNDPTDVGELADAIQQVLEDPVVRDTLRQRGLARAREFSWPACATAHLALYRQVAEEHGGGR